jgi:3-phenylpropionate/trans-cinnamate dioxygenase ferredoxin reductase component
MGPPRTIAIAGASLAGASAAFALRDEGFDGRVVLVGDEHELPYERPPLSKKYLSGEQAFEKALVRPAAVYEERTIELLLGTPVASIDARDRALVLADGRRVRADRLLVATGGRNRRPPIPGLDLPGVHDLRTRADSEAIRAELRPGLRAVVVGMGFIGAEVAATLRGAGADVIAIEAFSAPLERVLGPEVGEAIAALHRDNGVELVLGEGVASLEGDGRVRLIRTASGRVVECDLVVAGLGIQPNTEVVDGTGVVVDDGIVVDELCRTSVDGIFAAGDVARHLHPVFGEHVRVEHWLNAIEQGGAAARSMLGAGAPYTELHWFWSDQYDANLQYAGFHMKWEQLVVRGRLDSRSYLACYVNGGRIDAAVGLNRAKDVRRIMPLIKSRCAMDLEQLRDESVDLRSLDASP